VATTTEKGHSEGDCRGDSQGHRNHSPSLLASSSRSERASRWEAKSLYGTIFRVTSTRIFHRLCNTLLTLAGDSPPAV
jgi:hypothetical protein